MGGVDIRVEKEEPLFVILSLFVYVFECTYEAKERDTLRMNTFVFIVLYVDHKVTVTIC